MNRRSATMPVHDVMTPSPMSVTPDTTAGELLALFDQHDFHAFPVIDRSGVVCGIVTKLDVLRLLRPDRNLRVPDFPTLSTRHVADVMRRGVISVEPEDPLVVAADLMVETRLHSLPVVHRKGGGPELVGIVSQGDLLRGLRFELAEAEHWAGGKTTG